MESGERRPLSPAEDGVAVGDYRLDPEALAWGREIISRAVPCDLLVIDEVGPLEVEQGQGWAIALDVLRTGRFGLALVVVRPELINAVQIRLPTSAPAVVWVTEENRDHLPERLLEVLRRES